jgi:hypothetical protein
MRLPNAQDAIVTEDKIVGYLLNLSHPDGPSKATFFESRGFRSDDWYMLANALRQLVRETDIVTMMETVHGQKYIVDGAIDTPSGAGAMVRTVWIVDRGNDVPRLVTAYPYDKAT